jgi:epoxyqueuosine reductase
LFFIFYQALLTHFPHTLHHKRFRLYYLAYMEKKIAVCADALKMEVLNAGFSRARILSPFDPADFCRDGTVPQNYADGSASLLVCALPYGNTRSPAPPPTARDIPFYGVIAPFARVNYYREAVMRLQSLSRVFRSRFGGGKSDYRILCNSPVNEKAIAEACGLGTVGENGLIISPEAGSLFVIAAMTLPVPLEADGPLSAEDAVFAPCRACSSLDRPPCVRACPTGALTGGGRVDLTRCIQRYASGNGEEIPPAVLTAWGNRLYGCTDCQDACPHNRRPIIGVETFIGSLPAFIDTRMLLALSDAEIKAMFRGTAMGFSWLGPRVIRRNAEIVLSGGKLSVKRGRRTE